MFETRPTRFADVVVTWMRTGKFEFCQKYHWFYAPTAWVTGVCFRVELTKKFSWTSFRYKYLATLWRNDFEDGARHRITLSEQETKNLWESLPLAVAQQEKKNDEHSQAYADKIKRLEIYP